MRWRSQSGLEDRAEGQLCETCRDKRPVPGHSLRLDGKRRAAAELDLWRCGAKPALELQATVGPVTCFIKIEGEAHCVGAGLVPARCRRLLPAGRPQGPPLRRRMSCRLQFSWRAPLERIPIGFAVGSCLNETASRGAAASD